MWVSIASGMSTRKDLEMLVENTGSVCATFLVYQLLMIVYEFLYLERTVLSSVYMKICDFVKGE